MKVLRLHLKAEWWHQIKSGEKLEEFRASNHYWRRRLRGREYDEIHLFLGYPKKGDESKVIKRKWTGYAPQKLITHSEFGNDKIWVYAINVSRAVYKFENVSCSRCGKDFGPGNSGFSDCESHDGMRAID